MKIQCCFITVALAMQTGASPVFIRKLISVAQHQTLAWHRAEDVMFHSMNVTRHATFGSIGRQWGGADANTKVFTLKSCLSKCTWLAVCESNPKWTQDWLTWLIHRQCLLFHESGTSSLSPSCKTSDCSIPGLLMTNMTDSSTVFHFYVTKTVAWSIVDVSFLLNAYPFWRRFFAFLCFEEHACSSQIWNRAWNPSFNPTDLPWQNMRSEREFLTLLHVREAF